MKPDDHRKQARRVMALGVGAFTQGVLHILKENSAEVCTYLTRNYAHYSPSLEGETFHSEVYPNPCKLMRDKKIDFVVPMSIDWILADWVDEFLSMNIPIFSPLEQGMMIERDRYFARKLCRQFKIPFPKAYVAKNRIEAENILTNNPRAYVIKNPLCSPTSPIHTIICETVEDTRSWLDKVDYAEGVFLQEYMGDREAGHIALISNGKIYSLVTNQEYKRSFNGNMGIIAGAPLGGLVEKDQEDKYGLARQLMVPLLPWLQQVGFHGPLQVTAIQRDHKWYVLEYNVRLGVTSGPMILQMLKNPLDVLWGVVNNQDMYIEFKQDALYGCSITLAGYGYPYTSVTGPKLPIQLIDDFDCDVWWNEVEADSHGNLYSTGHRIADVTALGSTLEQAIEKTMNNIRKIRCLSSYFRTDIGQSLWPPGHE